MEQFLEQLQSAALYLDLPRKRDERALILKKLMVICRNGIVLNTKQQQQQDQFNNPSLLTLEIDDKDDGGEPQEGNPDTDSAPILSAPLLLTEAKEGALSIVATMLDMYATLDDLAQMIADGSAENQGEDDEETLIAENIDNEGEERIAKNKMWWGYRALAKLDEQQKAATPSDSRVSAALISSCGVTSPHAIANIKSNFFAFFADIILIFTQHASVPVALSGTGAGSSEQNKKRRAENESGSHNNHHHRRVQVSLLEGGILLAIYESISMKLIEMEAPITQSVASASAKAIAAAHNNNNKNGASAYDKFTPAGEITTTASGSETMSAEESEAKGALDLLVRFRGLVLLARALIVATTLNYGHSLTAILGTAATSSSNGSAVFTLPLSKNLSMRSASFTASTINDVIRKLISDREQQKLKMLGIGGEGREEGEEGCDFLEPEDPETICALFTATDETRRRLIDMYRSATSTASAVHLVALQEELLVLLAGVEKDSEVLQKKQREAEEEKEKQREREATEGDNENNNDDDDNASKTKKDEQEETSGSVLPSSPAVKEGLRRAIVARLLHYRVYMSIIADIGNLVLSDMLHILVSNNCLVFNNQQQHDDLSTTSTAIKVALEAIGGNDSAPQSPPSSPFLATVSSADLNAFLQSDEARQRRILDRIVTPRMLLPLFSGQDDNETEKKAKRSVFEAALCPLVREVNPVIHFGLSSDYHRPVEGIIIAERTSEEEREQKENNAGSSAVVAIAFGLHPVASYIIDCLTRNVNDSLRILNEVAIETSNASPIETYRKMIVAIESETLETVTASKEKGEKEDDDNAAAEEERGEGGEKHLYFQSVLDNSTTFISKVVTAASLFEIFSFASNPMAICALPSLMTFAYVIRPTQVPELCCKKPKNNNNVNLNDGVNLVSFALLNPLRAVIGARLVALANRSVAAIQYIFGDYYSSQSNASSGGNKGDGAAAPNDGSDDDMSGSGRGCAALVRRLVADNTYQIGKEILSAQQKESLKNSSPLATAEASFTFQPSLVNASVATSAFSHRSFVLFPAVFWALSVHSVLSFSIAWLIKTHHMQPVATQTAGRLQQMSNALYRLTESIRVDKVVTASAAAVATLDEITDDERSDDDDDNENNDEAREDEDSAFNTEKKEKSKAKKKKNNGGANGGALVTVAADDDTHNGERDGGVPTATVVSAGLLKNLSASLDAAFAVSDTISVNGNGFVFSTTATFLKGGLRGGRLIESSLSSSSAVVASVAKKDAVTNLNVVAPYLALPFVGLWLAAGVTPSFTSSASTSSSSIRTAIQELMRASLSALTQSYESSPDYAVHAANIAAAKAPKAHIYMTSAGKMTISAIVDTIIASLQRVKVQKSALFVDYSNSEKRLKLKEVAESGVAIGADPSSLEVSAEGGGSDTVTAANRIKTAEDIAAITAAQKRANQSQPNLIKESEEAASAEPAFERSNRFRYLRTALSQYAQIHVIDTDPETPLNENLIAWLHTVGRNTAVRRAAYLAQRKEIRRMNALDGTDATNANAMSGGKGGKAGDLQQNAPLGQMIYRLRTGTLVIQKVKDAMNNVHPRARIHQAAFSSLLRGFHRLACSGGSEAALRQAQALVSRCLAHSPMQVRDRCEDMLCAYLNEAILDVHGRQKALALAAAAAAAASSSSSSATVAQSAAATNALGLDDAGAKGKLSTSSSISSQYSDLAYRNLLAPSNQRSALALCLQCLYTAVAQSASARSASSEILMNSTAAASNSSSSSGTGVLLHTHEDAAITPPVDPVKPLNWIITTAEEQSKAHATFMANALRKQQQQQQAHHANDGLVIGSKRGRGGSGADSSVEITMSPAQSAALFEADEAKRGNRYSYLATRLLATMLHMHSGDGARGILSSLLTAPPSMGGSLLALPDSTLPGASASGATSSAAQAAQNSSGVGNRGDSSGNHPLPSRAFYDFFDACPMITNFMWTYWHCNACLNDERANLGMGVLAHIAQTRPAYRGRAIASLLYFSTIERRSARNAAIHHLNTFMTSRVTMDYMTVEERDAYLNIVVEFALKQCDTLSETVKAVGAVVENPNCPSDAAAAFSSGSGGAEDAEQTSSQISASPQPPVILTTQLSTRLKNKYHLLSLEKIEALERVMTFAYDDPKQSVNAIADHQMVRLKLLQAWAASHASASNNNSATHPLDAIRPEQAYLQTNEAAREIVDQNLSLLFAMCRIDARHAVTLVKKLLDIYSTFATITKAQAKAIEAITHFGPHAAAAAFSATRGAYAFAASEHAAPNTNLIHALQRFFLGTSLCSAILYSADVDNVLRGLFGRVRSNSADIDSVNAPEKLKVDLSQQEIFATRLMPVIRQSPLASSDLVIKIMSVTASSVRLFMTEIAQLPYPLTHESHTKLSTIMTIVHTHCKFLFANKSAVGAMAPPSIAPQKASFTTQLFGAAFGHSTPISRSTTTVVVPHPNNPAFIAAGGQPQTHIIPTVSSAVLGTVVLANKRTFEAAKASAQTFVSLAKDHPVIPCDIRMALPILGLVDRAELREVFVPAFVRFFAATEALRVPVEAPKSDYFRNLMGAEQIPISNASAAATNTAGASDSSSPSSGLHRQLSAPCSFLSLMQGSAAIVDLTLQEVMWNLLVPCEIPQPPVASAAGDEETATPLNGTDQQHHKNGKPQLLLNATNKRGLGTLDFITETMLVCNRVRRGGSASASTIATDAQHHNPQSIAANAKTTELLARYDHLLFGAANAVSISTGSRLVRMIVARRTRPTVCPLSPTAPCLKGSSSAAIQLLNEILLMPSSSAAASDNAFSWFDKKLGAGASAAAASASALSNAGLMVYGGVGNSGAGFMAKPQSQALLTNGTTPAALVSASAAAAMNKITPIAPFAVTVPQNLFLGSLDLFKTRLRHCPDVTVVAGGGGANAGGAHSALTTAYVDSRGIAVVQLVLEWAKGVTTRLTEVVVRLANRSPLDSAAAYLTQQITLHLAPDTIAPAVAVAAVAGPTVNKILMTLTGRNTVTATAFPPLEPLLKAVDVSTLYDRLQRVPNIMPSADVSRTVSPLWGGMPSDSFWLLYSSLHITAIRNDANYSEPVRERGARALANIITDSCVATIIAAPSPAAASATNVSATNQQTSLTSNSNMSSATVTGAVPSAIGGEDSSSSSRPLESVMLAHWALLFSEEHWSRVEDHFLALPDKRLLEVLTARPKLQQAFLAAHEANPRHHHIVAQLHQQ